MDTWIVDVAIFTTFIKISNFVGCCLGSGKVKQLMGKWIWISFGMASSGRGQLA